MNKALLLSSITLAMVSAIMAVVYVLGAVGHSSWILWEELLAVALMPAPYVAAAVAVPVAGVALVMRRLRTPRARWLSQGPWISAALLVIGSLLLLGPTGAFHHMIRFGVLGYMVVDCESSPGDLAIPLGRCGVRGSMVLLGATISVWLGLAFLLNGFVQRRAARSAGSARADEGDGGR